MQAPKNVASSQIKGGGPEKPRPPLVVGSRNCNAPRLSLSLHTHAHWDNFLLLYYHKNNQCCEKVKKKLTWPKFLRQHGNIIKQSTRFTVRAGLTWYRRPFPVNASHIHPRFGISHAKCNKVRSDIPNALLFLKIFRQSTTRNKLFLKRFLHIGLIWMTFAR